MGKPALADIALMADALREIATAIGCPANADPLTDLDGLVSMVRGLAERAETVRVVTADRDALRIRLERVEGEDVPILTRSLDLADDSYLTTKAALEAAGYPHVDGQPLADRVAMLAAERDDLMGHGVHPDRVGPSVLDVEIERLTAERDRRIEPVDHARAVRDCFVACFTGALMEYGSTLPQARMLAAGLWLESAERATLLARVGPEVLAEVER